MMPTNSREYIAFLLSTRPTVPPPLKNEDEKWKNHVQPCHPLKEYEYHAPRFLLPSPSSNSVQNNLSSHSISSSSNHQPVKEIRKVKQSSKIKRKQIEVENEGHCSSSSRQYEPLITSKEDVIANTSTKNNKWDLLQRDSPRSKKVARSFIRNFTNDDDFLLSNSINLHKHSSDTGITITNTIVQEVCAMNPNIVSLSLMDCTQINDIGLWAISRSCGTQLKEVILSGCLRITHIGLRSLVIKCTKIELLDVSNCARLDDRCLRVIAANLVYLSNIILSYCPNITDRGVSEIAKCCPKLSVLRLRNCDKIGEFGDRALLEIGKRSSLLKILDLYGCNHVGDAGLKAVSRGCPLIHDFHLSGCFKVTKNGIQSLISGCQKLLFFTFAKCPNMTDADVSRIVHGCPNLLKLDFSDCTSIGALSLQAIVSTLLDLKELNLSGCLSIDDNALSMLAQVRKIRCCFYCNSSPKKWSHLRPFVEYSIQRVVEIFVF